MSTRRSRARRQHTVRAVVAAALAAAALTACTTVVDGHPQAATSPDLTPTGHEVTGAAVTAPPPAHSPDPGEIYPGARMTLPRPDLGPGRIDYCTAGWLVALPDGRTGVMSAGHCQAKGLGANLTSTGTPIGTYVERTYQGLELRDHDAALIVLDPGLPVDTWALGTTPVAGVASAADLAQRAPSQICYAGSTTGGGAHCGPLTDVDAANMKLHFAPETIPIKGDSGGPVWAILSDGTVAAAGVLLGKDDQTGIVEAGLIEPWLRTWNLKVRI